MIPLLKMPAEKGRAWMWINHLFLGFIGLVCGVSVASGSFAFAVKLGIIPQMAGKSKTAGRVMTYENATIAGGMAGNIISVFSDIQLPLGRVFLGAFGLSAGIFVGCLAVALAEIIDVYPIMYRRMKLKIGMEWILSAAAVGKMAGALFYFMRGFGEGQ